MTRGFVFEREVEAVKVRPDRSTFDELASSWALVPMWTELLADVSTPVGVFPALAADGPGILLESVERSERWGRYSFAAGDPAAVITADRRGVAILDLRRRLPIAEPRPDQGVREQLRRLAHSLAGPRLPELPSLTGGLMGYLAYEAAELLDDQPVPRPDSAPCPAIGLLVVDRAVVFDHWRQRLLLVAHVPSGAYEEGASALEGLAETVSTATAPAPTPIDEDSDAGVEAAAGGRANMEDARYRQIVSGFKDHILAGDIYQGVPSRRVSFPAAGGGYPIYRRLRVSNPAPYMFFLRMLSMELAGSSPEPLVRVEGRRASARPIAGTRPRGATDIRDRLLEHELLADPKEQAEHAMLVDLARNDLGRVCRPGTVRPTELMVVERFSKVMHIVSTVEGELGEGQDALDALAVTFPAGTVTGAPKRRAMELIAEAEPTARGPYAGAVGYRTFSGDLDFCITIRTAVIADGQAHLQTGAGVVADSDPQMELGETKAKAAALLPAVAGGAGPIARMEDSVETPR